MSDVVAPKSEENEKLELSIFAEVLKGKVVRDALHCAAECALRRPAVRRSGPQHSRDRLRARHSTSGHRGWDFVEAHQILVVSAYFFCHTYRNNVSKCYLLKSSLLYTI